MVFSYLQRLPIKPLTIGCLLFLFIYSSWILHAYDRLLGGIAIVVFYSFFDVLWTYARNRAWYVPLSSWISGLILALIGAPSGGVFGILAISFVAVFSKHVIHYGALRHIFNPAAFSLAALAFLGSLHPTLNIFALTWWGIAWIHISNPLGGAMLWIIVFIGSFILWRLRRFHVALSFLIFYEAAFVIIRGLAAGFSWDISWVLRQHILDSMLIFFVSIMLIEPITSSFPLRRHRIFYGASVATFAGILTHSASTAAGVWFLWLDPLIGGLLLGNLVASISFLPRRMVL